MMTISTCSPTAKLSALEFGEEAATAPAATPANSAFRRIPVLSQSTNARATIPAKILALNPSSVTPMAQLKRE
jgi:hypothetical protein